LSNHHAIRLRVDKLTAPIFVTHSEHRFILPMPVIQR
jgi:hypothetical protein